MLHEIIPRLENEYYDKGPKQDSTVFAFLNSKVLIKKSEEGNISFPVYDELSESLNKGNFYYTFSIGKKEYFLFMSEEEISLPGYQYETIRDLREETSKEICFAGVTAYHLFNWYHNNVFCGTCGSKLVPGKKERVLVCPKCGRMIYPSIAPAVIVGVTDGDRILMTKYADREYKKYALIAGFTEIGETLEQTVQREVMEEVGLKVKNIRYYKSQPWGFDSNILMGFFADLDGDDSIKMDENELSTAEWINRDELKNVDDGISLTREMMGVFERGQEK